MPTADAAASEEAPPRAAPGKSTGRARAFRALRAALVVAVLGIVGVRVARDAPSLATLAPKGSAADLALAALAALVGYVALPTSLPVLLKATGRYDPALRGFYYRIWLQAFFFRYIPGKVALLAERVRLGRFARLDGSTSVLLLAWETPLLVLGASVVCAGSLGPVLAGMVSSRAALAYLSLAPVLAVVALALMPRVFAWLSKKPAVRRRLGDLDAVKVGPLAQVAVTAVFAVAWLGLGTAFFFVARYFVPLGPEHFGIVVFWFVASYVAGFVATIAPAGLGIREGLLVFGLAPILPPAQAAVVAVAGRIFLTALEMIVIGVARLAPMPAAREEAAHAG
ncbi:MAG TPA: hypothetical protein VHB21_01360 [Minicystis sp.]|nr:hypothetical protein [Minicystis sp.]